jgi:glycosyltransferase involved in cell wall biosynthesis
MLDLELILVDDGSTDRSGALCDEAAAHDSRIRVLHQANQGLSAARNAGIQLCSSDYLTFVDSDDWLDKRCIEILTGLMEDENADVAICRMVRAVGHGRIENTNQDDFCRAFNGEEALRYLDRHLPGLMSVSCGKLFSSHLFSDIHFPQGRYHEDEFTTYRLLYHAEKIVITKDQLYYHRIRPESITQSALTMRRAMDATEAFLERGSFFKEEGLPDLASSSFKHAFYLYRDYSLIIFDDLPVSEKHEWLKLGSEIYLALQKTAFDFRFRKTYQLYFRLPVSLRNQFYRIRSSLRTGNNEMY